MFPKTLYSEGEKGYDKAKQNPGHYVAKQKQCELIRVEDTSNILQMNLAGLIPNFQNVASQSDQSNEVFYQVKQFKCRPNFSNVHTTDYLHINSILYLEEFQANNPFYNTPNTNPSVTIESNYFHPLSIKIGGEINEFLSYEQIVQRMNWRLQDEISYRNSLYPILGDNEKIAYLNLANLMEYGSFYIDSNQRLNFQLNFSIYGQDVTTIAKAPFAHRYPASSGVDAGADYHIVGYKIVVTVSNHNSEMARYRLQRLFGMYLYHDDDLPYLTINAPFETFKYQTFFNIADQYRPGAGVVIPGRNKKNEVYQCDVQSWPLYLMIYRNIYLRSNAHSIYWNKRGNRTNVIAVFPVQNGVESLDQIFRPVGADDRTYNIRDSLNTFQHLQLEFTDEFGFPIEFTDKYEIEIAVFFSIADAAVYNY